MYIYGGISNLIEASFCDERGMRLSFHTAVENAGLDLPLLPIEQTTRSQHVQVPRN